MEETFRKLANRSVKAGDNRSLVDVGYTFANMDDGWQDCGAGVNGSFHDAEGFPILDPAKFSNVSAMTELARTLGLRSGFYVNNYICGSGECAGGVGGAQYTRVMHSTVAWLKQHGYEYLKVDSGGCYNDMQLWHDLLLAVDHTMTVENCHQGGEPPNATWCPYALWRVGADVNGEFADVEILQVIQALNQATGGPGARTGCRPYPDFMSLPGFKNSSTVRSNFGLYAIMGTPMIFSFDVRDDSKLLPLWGILTNEEVLAVNQDATAAAGTMLRFINPQNADQPRFAWAVNCNASDPGQRGWSYDAAAQRVRWVNGSSSELCLSATRVGAGLALADCNVSDGSSAPNQAWMLSGGRLWQARESTLTANVGNLHLSTCADTATKPGQQWTFSSNAGETTNVQVNLTTRMGGCWEITGCSFNEGASVGTKYGCKPIPKPIPPGGKPNPCKSNGAWTFNVGNSTITSEMSGHCLESSGSSVSVSSCSGNANQQWMWTRRRSASATTHGSMQIESKAYSGQCIDDGDVPSPPGTDGNCAALTHVWTHISGPGVSLQNPGSNGSPCEASDPPTSIDAFALNSTEGVLRVGETQCIAALRGEPSPFGPIQLWAKPLAGGSVAMLLAHRGGGDEPATTVRVDLNELPQIGSGTYIARDVWQHADVPNAIINGTHMDLVVKGQGSVFYVLRPTKKKKKKKMQKKQQQQQQGQQGKRVVAVAAPDNASSFGAFVSSVHIDPTPQPYETRGFHFVSHDAETQTAWAVAIRGEFVGIDTSQDLTHPAVVANLQLPGDGDGKNGTGGLAHSRTLLELTNLQLMLLANENISMYDVSNRSHPRRVAMLDLAENEPSHKSGGINGLARIPFTGNAAGDGGAIYVGAAMNGSIVAFSVESGMEDHSIHSSVGAELKFVGIRNTGVAGRKYYDIASFASNATSQQQRYVAAVSPDDTGRLLTVWAVDSVAAGLPGGLPGEGDQILPPDKWHPVVQFPVPSAWPVGEKTGCNRLRIVAKSSAGSDPGGHVAFISCYAKALNSVYVVDLPGPTLRNASDAMLVHSIPFADEQPTGMLVVNNALFVAGGRSVMAFDISDPTGPMVVGVCNTSCERILLSAGQNAHSMAYFTRRTRGVLHHYLLLTAQIDNNVGIIELMQQRIIALVSGN